jgi:hypothetical protein
VDVATYRIVQAALTNVTRHADPATATVRLACTDRGVTVQVDDKGRGLLTRPVAAHLHRSELVSGWGAIGAARTRGARCCRSGQGADPVAGEGEDVEAGAVADAGGRAQVGAERRLAVDWRGHEVEPAARVEQAGAEAGA